MKYLILSLFTFFQFMALSLLEGSDSAQRLHRAVQRMNAWMGVDENASRWRQTLHLNQLETQAAKGDRADLEQLKLVHARFASSLPGLEHPVFVDVRRAIEHHIAQLDRAQKTDIESYLVDTDGRFQAPTLEQLEEQRAQALYFLELFQRQYLRNDTELREFLFEELELTPTMDLVRGLDFGKLMPGANDSSEQETERSNVRREAIRPLVEASERFNKKSESVQDIYFNSAQASLDQFVRVVINATDKDLRGYVKLQCETIRDNYSRLGQPGERMASARVAAALGALESTLQHGDLITAIRRKHSFPNAEVEIKASLISNRVGPGDSRTLPVSELILGRQIYGCAHSQSQAKIELVDDPTQVVASIRLLGTIHSDTYTRQGPVTAFAGSDSQFDGYRNVYGNIGGFFATEPCVALSLQSYFKNVDCRLRVVQKVAYKQYLRDKSASEAIGAGRAQGRVLNEFSQKTNDALSNGRNKLASQFDKINQYRSLIPSVFAFSRPDSIVAVAQKQDSIHLAASQPPQINPVPADLRVRLHESMVVNYVDPMLVGRTMTNGEIAEMIQQASGEKIEGLAESTDPEENWSITFAKVQPFQFMLDGQVIRIGIIGERFTQADRSIRTSLLISLAFRIVKFDGNLYLVRDGDFTVEALDKDRLDARGVAFKTFLEKKLNQRNIPDKPADQAGERQAEQGDLPSTSDQKVAEEVGGFRLPGNLLPVEQLQTPEIAEIAKQMQLVELRLDGGWLHASWKQAAQTPPLVFDLSGIHSISNLDELKPPAKTNEEAPATPSENSVKPSEE